MTAELNLTDAAELAGVNRSTLWRKIKKGELSVTKDASGQTLIHIAELQRVYPNLKPVAPSIPLQTQQTQPPATVQLEADNRVLQAQLDAKDREAEDLRRQLREEKERHEEARVEKTRILNMLEEAQKRIPALPAPVEASAAEDPPVKRGFWNRLFQ